MGRGRGGSGKVGGSRRGRRSEKVTISYKGRVHHANSKKDKANSGLSKDLGKSMFTYKKKDSSEEMGST